MALYCKCKICQRSNSSKNRQALEGLNAEEMKGAIPFDSIQNDDWLIHMSKHNFTDFHSTEIPSYRGTKLGVAGFFWFYPSQRTPPPEGPPNKIMEGFLDCGKRGPIPHQYIITGSDLRTKLKHINIFRPYARNETLSRDTSSSPPEVVLTIGCGTKLIFDKGSRNNKGSVIHTLKDVKFPK